MQRPILDETKIHPAILTKIGAPNEALFEMKNAVQTHDVVVVGMKQNPHPGKAQDALKQKLGWYART